MLKRIVSVLKPKRLFPLYINIRNDESYACPEMPPTVPACFWTTLANGVRVISETTLTPLACVKMFIEVGPRYENPCNNGAAHFIEHLAFKGFPSVRRCAFECALEDLGIKMTVQTEREYQVFTAIGPNENVACMFKYFYKIVCNLDFDPFEIECARTTCLQEMAEVERDPKALCFEYLHKTAFQGTTLGQSVIGPSQNYKNFNVEFISRYHDQSYQPFRIVLAASSVYTHQDIVCMATNDFCAMRDTTTKVVYWPCRYTGSMAMFRNDDYPYAHVAFGVETGGYGCPDYIKYLLIKHHIGVWDASLTLGRNAHSHLARACDLGKICVHYEGFYIPYKDVGLLGIYFVVPREWDIDDMFYNVSHEWMQMCTTLTRSELMNSIPVMIMDLAKNVDGSERACHDMGLQMLHYGCRRNFLDMSEAAACYSEEHIRETMMKIIYDRCPVVAGVGPTESIPEYNRIRAAMHWVRL